MDLFLDIAKKLNHYDSSNDVFLKDYKKTEYYTQKEDCGRNIKTIASEHTKIIRAVKWLPVEISQQVKD